MKLHRLVANVLVSALAVVGVAASAAPLSGSVSTAGTLCLGSTPSTAPGTACTPQNVSTMTYFDFINGNNANEGASPGTPGTLYFLTSSGDLAPLIGRTGSIYDFSFPASGTTPFAAVNPLWSATGSDGATYTYTLAALDAIDRSVPNTLDLRGSGNLCRNGIDCSLFSFIYTTQNAAGSMRTTFSLSQSGLAAVRVPEPASLGLLGLGLAGFAVGARRRRRA